ncbi:type VII secretion target [Tsukamurella pseudospumae]|uniref:type VII secretion target n=1 Tax=Tsukamurella pseudospumae TaxID=239498 RepID=UPI000B2BA31F|nr:type VII secretion target [Tsukamurella pseudospumae]
MPKDKLDVTLSVLHGFSQTHGVTEAQLRAWASEDGNFPMTYLQTHGIANNGTYLKLLQHYLTRRVAGDTFAQANSSTATALTSSATIFGTNDSNEGDRIQAG